jgi:hypothetical protein
MLTLRCTCAHSGDLETKQSPRFRLEGKDFFDAEGKLVAALGASSIGWELHGGPSGVLDIEVLELGSNVSIYLADGSRLGPFGHVKLCGGAVRTDTETFAQFNGDKNAWCCAPLNRACDPMIFETGQ